MVTLVCAGQVAQAGRGPFGRHSPFVDSRDRWSVVSPGQDGWLVGW